MSASSLGTLQRLLSSASPLHASCVFQPPSLSSPFYPDSPEWLSCSHSSSSNSIPSELRLLLCGHLVCVQCVCSAEDTRDSLGALCRSQEQRFEVGQHVVCPKCGEETRIMPLTTASLLAWSLRAEATYDTEQQTLCACCERPFDDLRPVSFAHPLASGGHVKCFSQPAASVLPALSAWTESALEEQRLLAEEDDVEVDDEDTVGIMLPRKSAFPLCQCPGCKQNAEFFCTKCNMLLCADCEKQVHSMRLFEHHRARRPRDSLVPWELHEAAIPRCRKHSMPLNRYDKAGIRLCCDVCAIPEEGEPVPIIIDMADARNEVFHHLFCSLKALSQGIAELQLYIRGMNDQIRHLDSLKRDLLKNLYARYTAYLQAREEEREKECEGGEANKDGDDGGTKAKIINSSILSDDEAVQRKMRAVLRGQLNYPATLRVFQETMRSTATEVLLGALTVHREALFMRAHDGYSIEMYLEVIHMCRQYAAACSFACRASVPATLNFRFEPLPSDFLIHPLALHVPFVCVSDVPAPHIVVTNRTDTTLDVQVVASISRVNESRKAPSFWTQLVFCRTTLFQVMLTADSPPASTTTDTDTVIDDSISSQPSLQRPRSVANRPAVYFVSTVSQVTDKNEVHKCAALHLSGLRPSSSYTLVARTLVDNSQVCSDYGKVLSFTTASVPTSDTSSTSQSQQPPLPPVLA